MDLTQQEQALKTAESTLSGYTKDLPSEIQAEITKAWTPGLERVTGETQRMMSEYLPRYWGIGEQLGGTTAADLSPTQKMQVMGRELGTMGGELTSNAMLADYLGGKAEDMYDKALQASQLGYGMAADAYSREFQKYQLAWQAAEAEKERQFQASQAAAARAAQANLLGGGGTTGEEEVYEVDETTGESKGVTSPAATSWGKRGGLYTSFLPSLVGTIPYAALTDISQGQTKGFPTVAATAAEYAAPFLIPLFE